VRVLSDAQIAVRPAVRLTPHLGFVGKICYMSGTQRTHVPLRRNQGLGAGSNGAPHATGTLSNGLLIQGQT
jgi:hypothetical protein